MKRIPYLVMLQGLLAIISGFLISKMSWIGRIGISWFMPQYKIFKSWWQTAIVLFLVQCLIIGILWVLQRKARPRAALWASLALLLTALIGLYFTYNDFQSSFSHRLMKEKFHLGFYLFWLGWAGSALSFLVTMRRDDTALESAVSG